jgi:hypothetical protein
MVNSRPSPEIVAARQAEIAQRYHRKRKNRTPAQLAALRLRDLSALFRARYGHMLPDDDAGRDDAGIALAHMATLASARGRMSAWVTHWMPWMTNGEARTMIDYALTTPRYWTADSLAWRLHLNAIDRATLGITTIGAIDLPKAARARLRKLKDRDRKRKARAARKAASAP